jgi:DsbC/DsbD-like thiol-disulfide interchange protein
VTSRYFEEAYQERDTVSSILVRLGQQVAVHATKIAGAHVTVTSFATDEIAAQGTHFSLVVEIAPGPRVHVYAPGATDYKPVTISVDPQAGLVVRSPLYPKSEDYFFKPLKEHVPVYQHPFRIIQDVTLDPSKEGTAALKDVTSLTINGRFDYQACDDTVCFAPQSVPLAWTIGVKPLDRERPKPR